MKVDFYPQALFDQYLEHLIERALNEDVGEGDHTSLSIFPEPATLTARLLVKTDGIIAGTTLAERIFRKLDPSVSYTTHFHDGERVTKGDIVFDVSGQARAIITAERLVLNFMQHLSGIASKTNKMLDLIKDYPAKLLDTRKTTPGLRLLEKYAVKTGGGNNHRIGLYDMILIKDNHIDFAGSITKAVEMAKEYVYQHQLQLKIEVELRSFEDIAEALKIGSIERVLLDNFTPEDLAKAIKLIDRRLITEASGGINDSNIVDYAKSGVDFISCGFLTHTLQPLDLSMKINI